MAIGLVEVLRGDIVESRHRVHVAAVHAEDGLVAHVGDAHLRSFVRSAIKMFQALPLVETGGVTRFGLTTQELALCTASHGGEPFHVATASSILEKAGCRENDLACGPHPPMHAPSAEALRAAGETPTRLHNNCSGKHSGLLAFTTDRRWPTAGYHLASHPTQARVLDTLNAWMRPASAIDLAIDGCGLPTFSLPLSQVAAGCARFAAAAADGVPAPHAIVTAMTMHPEYVAGTNRLCTDLMRAARGTLFAKVGAEGYYCVGIPARRLGIAIKVEDGALRAAEAALLAVLHHLDALTSGELSSLSRYASPPTLNTRNEVVGSIRTRIDL